MFRDAGKDLPDLRGEFPGWHHDKAFDACIAFAGFFTVDFIDQRNGESRRFTCSRLGDGQNVFPSHDGRDGFELDIRRPFKTKLLKVLFNVFGDMIFFKLHGTSIFSDSLFPECFDKGIVEGLRRFSCFLFFMPLRRPARLYFISFDRTLAGRRSSGFLINCFFARRLLHG